MDIFDYQADKNNTHDKSNKAFITSIIAIVVAVIMSIIALIAIFVGSKSAYDVAVDNGYTGSVTEWLTSLQGDDATSFTVEELYSVYLETYPDATMDEFLSAYLSIDYSPTEQATSTALRSSVSVNAYFTITSSSGPFGTSTKYEMISQGSGVIVDLDTDTGEAYIVTNYHVVYESSADTALSNTIYIFPYGKETTQGLNSDFEGIECDFIGGSTTRDIAIIKADENDILNSGFYREVDVAESDSAHVGSTCIAVGNAEGLGISATSGIVSMESEYISCESVLDSSQSVTHRVIRTDTAINSGNSGGGLFNSNAELIGIVNAKTIADDVEGIANAIPVSVAMGIANLVMDGQKKSNGSYYKYAAGFTSTSTNSYAVLDADGYATTIDEVEITDITSSSPCYGVLKEGDILLSFVHNDGASMTITKSYQVQDYMYNVRQGDSLTFTVLRNSTQVELDTFTVTDDYYSTI